MENTLNLENAYLASRDATGVKKYAQCENSKEEFVAMLGNPIFINQYRVVKQKQNTSIVPRPLLDSAYNVIVDGEQLGRAEIVFLRPIPIEPRLRIAYEIMYGMCQGL